MQALTNVGFLFFVLRGWVIALNLGTIRYIWFLGFLAKLPCFLLLFTRSCGGLRAGFLNPSSPSVSPSLLSRYPKGIRGLRMAKWSLVRKLSALPGRPVGSAHKLKYGWHKVSKHATTNRQQCYSNGHIKSLVHLESSQICLCCSCSLAIY